MGRSDRTDRSGADREGDRQGQSGGGEEDRQGGPTQGPIGGPIVRTDRGDRQGGPNRRAAKKDWQAVPL